MPKKSKKRARQAKRRAERREAREPQQLETTPADLLLQRIRREARQRLEAAARRADAEQNEAKRRLERAKAKGEA